MSAKLKKKAALIAIIFGISSLYSYGLFFGDRSGYGCAYAAEKSPGSSCTQYTVIRGDTIGAILDRLDLHRIWGDHGTAREMVNLNPGKIQYNGDLISPGIILQLPREVSCEVLTQAEQGRYPASEASPQPTMTSPVSTEASPPPVSTEASPSPVSSVSPTPSVSSESSPPSVSAETAEPTQHSETPTAVQPLVVQSVQIPVKPVVQASPATPAVPESEQEFGDFLFAPQLMYVRLNATDNVSGQQAALSSSLSDGFTLAWGQKWSPELQTKLYFGMQSLQFPAAISGVTIANPQITTHEFGFSGEYSPDPLLGISVNLGATQNFLVQGLNTRSFQFSEYIDPSAGAGIMLYPLVGRSIRLGVGFDATIFFPSNGPGYSVQLGEATEGKLSVIQGFGKTLQLQGTLGYESLNQNNSLIQESLVQLLFEIGVTFRIRTY